MLLFPLASLRKAPLSMWGLASISCQPSLPCPFCAFPCSVTPIFTLSSVSGESLDLLKVFLNILPPLTNSKEQEELMQQLTEFQVDEIYTVPEVGTVVGGTLSRVLVCSSSAIAALMVIRELRRFQTSHPDICLEAEEVRSFSLGLFLRLRKLFLEVNPENLPPLLISQD
ncbi:GTP-binding protein 2-like [Heterocephalus glaber]|uniref:GTP-binding protein 2-like n=1 Tax=Heterocephalus glaber TaxID=10181 RepID=A0AAX6SZ42_HETGA|nr:GTP-binding protein 2-like [Heterocephalus glaber]